jgi:hypothetical protein
MIADRHLQRNPLRRIAAYLAVIALLMRGLIAPGFMPDLNGAAEGGLRLVICTPTGAKVLGQPPGEPGSGDGQSSDLCPFAALSHAATLTDAETQPAPASPQLIQPAELRTAPLEKKLATLRARSPPHFRS